MNGVPNPKKHSLSSFHSKSGGPQTFVGSQSGGDMQSGDLQRDIRGDSYKFWSQTDPSSDSGPTMQKLYELEQVK